MSKQAPEQPEIHIDQFLEAVREACQIINDGDFEKQPHKYYVIEEAYSQTKTAQTRPVIEQCQKLRKNNLVGSDTYRIATNSLLLRYLSVIANSAKIIEKSSRLENTSIPLQQMMAEASSKVLSQIRFSKKYYNLETEILSTFTDNVEKSGRLHELYNWKAKTLEERENIIRNIISSDFMDAIRSTDAVLEKAQEPFVQFQKVRDGTFGLYLPGKVFIEEKLLKDPDAVQAFMAAAHESAHHTDELIERYKPQGMDHDAELLGALGQLRLRISRSSFHKYMYIHMPDEKHAFHGESIAIIREKIRLNNAAEYEKDIQMKAGKISDFIRDTTQTLAQSVRACFVW